MATSSRHRAPVRSALKAGANPPAKQGRYQRRELAAATGGAVLLVVIAMLSAWAHYSVSTFRPASPHAAAVQPANSMRTPLGAWLNDAEPSINALVVARENIVVAAVQGDIAGTRTACQTAAGALATLQEHLPSPNLGLTNTLQQAINNYRVGVRHCMLGTQKQDAVEIGEATVYIKQGYTDLQKAIRILEDDLSSDARFPDVLTASLDTTDERG